MGTRTRTARAWAPWSRQRPCKSHSECAQRATSPGRPGRHSCLGYSNSSCLIPPRPTLQTQTNPPSLPPARVPSTPVPWPHLTAQWSFCPPTQGCACTVGLQVSEDPASPQGEACSVAPSGRRLEHLIQCCPCCPTSSLLYVGFSVVNILFLSVYLFFIKVQKIGQIFSLMYSQQLQSAWHMKTKNTC